MRTDKGFTLIELMISMLVFSLIIASVYASHSAQQNTYQVQEQISEMQQNLRAAMYFMSSNIRMAGFDPDGTADAGLHLTGPTLLTGRVRVSMDIDEDGASIVDGAGNFIGPDTSEFLDVGFSTTNDSGGDGIPDADSDGDGIPDPVTLGRQYGGAGGFQPIAENIQAVEFRYLDSTGVQTAVSADVRAIQITIIARTEKPDAEFTNTMTYSTPGGQNFTYNDNYRRRMLTTTIRCRNLGF